MRLHLLLVPFLLLPDLQAQDTIVLRGTVSSEAKEKSFYGLMVVNKRTRTGVFGNSDGTYRIQALRTDTIMFGAAGLRTLAICVADSTPRAEYVVNVRLRELHYELREVEVLPQRKLKEIQKDIASLGYNEHDYQLSGVDALQSPITFLYQEFSRRERSKRLVAQLQNEDRKRALLRELLQKYVQYDIINLSDEAFDDFIDFCSVPDAMIKGFTQYEFLLYVKKKYELYSSLGPTRQH